MRVRVTPPDIIQSDIPSLQGVTDVGEVMDSGGALNFFDTMPESIDYSNGLLVTCLSYFIWIVIFFANAYAIVNLCLDAK